MSLLYWSDFWGSLQGIVFHRKGTKVNPLDMVSMPYELIFFDGEDEDQLKYVIKKYEESEIKPKLILTAYRFPTFNKIISVRENMRLCFSAKPWALILIILLFGTLERKRIPALIWLFSEMMLRIS